MTTTTHATEGIANVGAGARHLPDPVRKGIALCLSGGGFRATLFHSGALRRLNELGVLGKVDSFVSVSGGSILNGVLAARWHELKADSDGRFENFDAVMGEPIRDFCKKDLRTSVLLWKRGNPLHWGRLFGDDHSVTDLLADAYARELGLGRRIDALNPTRRFIFCAANLETGASWEFEARPDRRAEMGDYWTGKAVTGSVTLAQAVAASSAFPPAFPPLVLRFPEPGIFRDGSRELSLEARTTIPLTDGGVYDNLGLEPVWKSHETVFASDAGSPFALKDNPGNDTVSRLRRSFDVISNQTGALRRRWFINLLQTKVMRGTYWGIATDYRHYDLPGAQGYDDALRPLLEGVRTDLDAFTDAEIGCLENHGYALADAAIRRWASALVAPNAPAFRWPEPELSPANRAAVLAALQRSGERGIFDDLWRSFLERGKGWL
jgi:NTE family protein